MHQIRELVEQGIIEMLVTSLEQNGESKFLLQCLSAMESILREYKEMDQVFETEYNVLLNRIHSCGGYRVFEKMQEHVDENVYIAVSELIEKYLDFSTDY